MRSPLVQLLTARRFAPLFVTQFLGALNDNLLKSALGILVTFRLAEQSGMNAATLSMVASALFISPFFLFSGASGTLSDRFDKALIARWVKIAEIGIMALGAWGLWRGSVPVLLTTLFCLGTHSTVFGPIKYALLPQHLDEHELVAGNALIEAGTFLAILAGTIIGGSIALLGKGPLIVGTIGVVGAFIGWLSARQIPTAPPSYTGEAPRIRLFRDTVDVVTHVTNRPQLLLPILATSWFWLFAFIVVSGLPVFAKDVLFANEQVVTMMLALFAVGVGAGSILAEKLLDGEVSGHTEQHAHDRHAHDRAGPEHRDIGECRHRRDADRQREEQQWGAAGKPVDRPDQKRPGNEPGVRVRRRRDGRVIVTVARASVHQSAQHVDTEENEHDADAQLEAM